MSCGNKLFVTGEDIEVIAGHMYDLEFEVFLLDETPVDLQTPGTIVEWRMAEYGYNNIPLITKSSQNAGEIEIDANQANLATVRIGTDDTNNFDGAYNTELTIIDPQGNVSRPYKNITIIFSRIA